MCVEVQHDEGRVSVTVRDEGPGIPAEQVPQLFTRFFRGDPARPRAEGSGLGLSIAKAGADAHGGALEFPRRYPWGRFPSQPSRRRDPPLLKLKRL